MGKRFEEEFTEEEIIIANKYKKRGSHTRQKDNAYLSGISFHTHQICKK